MKEGEIESRVAAELRYLGRMRDYYFAVQETAKAIEVIDLYNLVYARWYYGERRTA